MLKRYAMARRMHFLKAAAILALAPLCLTAHPASVRLEGTHVVARDTAGVALWRVRPANPSRVSIRALADGGFDLGDGTVLTAQGRLRTHGDQTAFTSSPQQEPAWGPLTTIDSSITYDPPATPQFDPMNNAWVVNLDNEETTLAVIESSGVAGLWQNRQAIAGSGLELEGPPAMAIDPSGTVHVVCRNISSGQYQIIYSSNAGGAWQPPQVIYSSPYFFQNIDLATDSAGDVIVVFDRASQSTGLPQGWSIVYSSATGSWGPAQVISPPSQGFFLPSMAQSPDGSAVLLVYTGGAGVGLYYQFFDTGSQAWQTAASLSGTSQASFSSLSVGTKYPLTLDSFGNATLIVPFYNSPDGDDYELVGLRYVNGSWANRTTLIPWGPSTRDGDILDFGSIAQNKQGDVLAVGAAFSATRQTINAYRFTAGNGWDTEDVTELSVNAPDSHLGVAWFEWSGEAVVSYFAPVGLTTVMYMGGSWSYSPAVGEPAEISDALVTAPTGQVLLTTLSDTGYTQATWLRQ